VCAASACRLAAREICHLCPADDASFARAWRGSPPFSLAHGPVVWVRGGAAAIVTPAPTSYSSLARGLVDVDGGAALVAPTATRANATAHELVERDGGAAAIVTPAPTSYSSLARGLVDVDGGTGSAVQASRCSSPLLSQSDRLSEDARRVTTVRRDSPPAVAPHPRTMLPCLSPALLTRPSHTTLSRDPLSRPTHTPLSLDPLARPPRSTPSLAVCGCYHIRTSRSPRKLQLDVIK